MRIRARLLLTMVLATAAALLSQSSHAQPCGGDGGGSCGASSTVTSAGTRFCSDVESCKAFCSCACNLDLKKWRPVSDDGATICPGAPTTGVGMIPADSPDLIPIPKLRFVAASASVRATKETVEALKRLDDYLATSPSRAEFNYTVKVRNCYRPAIDDVEKECGFVLKAMHILNKYPEDDKKRAEWTPKLNPNNLGLAWPGATPHSAGNACDIVLVDPNGQESFDWRVGTGSAHSSIDQRLASKMLDEAVTNDTVGGRRLNFEAWHYEWGSTLGCRCKAPECADKFWPPLGTPNCK
jgi:hypothetical protein